MSLLLNLQDEKNYPPILGSLNGTDTLVKVIEFDSDCDKITCN